jgi:hypothetical protein
MNCDDVIRQLAVPTDDRDSSALAVHLSACPGCAAWARQAEQFERLWELTRPAEPSPEVWDSVWVRVLTSLDSTNRSRLNGVSNQVYQGQSGPSPKVDSTAEPHGHLLPKRLWIGIGLVGLAQAAAVLLAVTLTWRSSATSSPSQSRTVTAPDLASATISLEIEEGHLVVIHWDGALGKIEDRTPQVSDGVDDWLLGLNAVEGLADFSVALKE